MYEPKDVTSERFIHLLRDAEDPFYLKKKQKKTPCFYSKDFCVDEVTRRHTGIHDVNDFDRMMRSSQHNKCLNLEDHLCLFLFYFYKQPLGCD